MTEVVSYSVERAQRSCSQNCPKMKTKDTEEKKNQSKTKKPNQTNEQKKTPHIQTNKNNQQTHNLKPVWVFLHQIKGIQISLKQEIQLHLLLSEPKETTKPQDSEMQWFGDHWTRGEGLVPHPRCSVLSPHQPPLLLPLHMRDWLRSSLSSDLGKYLESQISLLYLSNRLNLIYLFL